MVWEPFKITYTSDYFQDLYDLAVELIRRGHAYVDHKTPEEIKETSLHIVSSLLPIRMQGDKWCIYPSYDYAHCIVVSLENITHLFMKKSSKTLLNLFHKEPPKLCTLEFETRRASYYWLLDALSLYQPYVWEYSGLIVTNIVMSKRKLNRLVTEKWVDGWDDPRLMTLAGLRRRGLTSTAINAFVRGIGITRSDCSMIRLDRLEYHIREELNKTAPRAMVMLHPLKKWPDAQTDDPSSLYKVPFSNVVYIDHTDFRMKDSKDYYGLSPGTSVLLRYAFPIKCTEVILGDDEETVVEVRAEYDPSKKTKPNGVLHWVAEPSSGVDPLKNPAELDEWLCDLNPQSKIVVLGAYSVPSLKKAAVGDTFQFERLVQLIRRGHAYVDHQTPEEIKEYKEKKMNSPWRDRPIAESLKLFDDMRRGMIDEGKATLRMKPDMQRDKWCIYPSYDYAHCIVDSLENITHSVPFSNVVYIDHIDFRMKDSKDYYGLAPSKSVLFRYVFPIKCTEVILGDDKETVVEGVLHWVAEPSPGVDPLKVEVRLFEKLFLSVNPAELDEWLGDLNPQSKIVVLGAYSVPSLKKAAVGDTFQFERLGMFQIDFILDIRIYSYPRKNYS
ncbi:hypothetical protein F0562_034058 [Nyssa sinensis]|uniref:glutamine--tRNA ligase n=1 Tax=Nyssa sinensis TaxID=561372 RepID=A0A5J5ADU1_9ASTE|nr:hypothetical protein F0562_034058 [Nyssa sinensis]